MSFSYLKWLIWNRLHEVHSEVTAKICDIDTGLSWERLWDLCYIIIIMPKDLDECRWVIRISILNVISQALALVNGFSRRQLWHWDVISCKQMFLRGETSSLAGEVRRLCGSVTSTLVLKKHIMQHGVDMARVDDCCPIFHRIWFTPQESSQHGCYITPGKKKTHSCPILLNCVMPQW